jgi:hypothetical protein
MLQQNSSHTGAPALAEVAEYAVGYAAALVQARRFAEAAGILRRVLKSDELSGPMPIWQRLCTS